MYKIQAKLKSIIEKILVQRDQSQYSKSYCFVKFSNDIKFIDSVKKIIY